MQNVCLVTMREVWTPEANNALLYKPHPQIFGPKLKQKGVAYKQVFTVIQMYVQHIYTI